MAIDGVPKPLTLALRDAGQFSAFVETGTYKGDTTRWAAGEFASVTTLEAYKPRYTKTKAGLKDLGNVRFVNDDSRNLVNYLPDVPAILWLDAHWCGDYEKSLGTSGECPLTEELAAVRPGDVVLIDDARLFITPPPRPHDPKQWPTMEQIRRALHGRYTILVKDVIVSVPLSLAPVVRKYLGVSEKMEAVVLTSNAYVGLIPAFCYRYLATIGATVPCTIVRYDKAPLKQAEVFKQFAIGKQADYTWSEGLLRYLEYHNDDHILLILEDYWLTGVDGAALSAAWQLMKANPDIDKFDLSGDMVKREHDTLPGDTLLGYSLFKARPEAQFLTSLQAAIWRTDFLRSALRPSENPWQFEKKGTRRVTKKCTVLGTQRPILSYVNACGGEGHKPGELDYGKIPNWMLTELRERRLV